MWEACNPLSAPAADGPVPGLTRVLGSGPGGLYRNRDVLRLWGAQLITTVGTQVGAVALLVGTCATVSDLAQAATCPRWSRPASCSWATAG